MKTCLFVVKLLYMKSGVNNKKAGSIAYNRLEMQISQTIHMAIELYDSLDYLFILDHDDDITLYDNQNQNNIVSYYQMKTSENYFLLTTILSENWLLKLHNHLLNPKNFVKELGLITNCDIKLSDEHTLNNNKTPFNKINNKILKKIQEDIANKNNIPIKDVDLSKFIHIRTALSIDKHQDIAEKEMGDFLYNKYHDIKVETIKTIFNSVIALLTKRQGYEKLSEDASFEDVKSNKGFSRTDFDEIIKTAIRINIPSFQDVMQLDLNFDESILALAYVKILADNNENSTSYKKMFNDVYDIVEQNNKSQNETIFEYVSKCKKIYEKRYPLSMYIERNSVYIELIVIIIILNKQQGFLS